MRTIIELKDIKRDFQVGEETVHALKEVSFAIEEGQFVTIMGKSGSGKKYAAQHTRLLGYAHIGKLPARRRFGAVHEQGSARKDTQ